MIIRTLLTSLVVSVLTAMPIPAVAQSSNGSVEITGVETGRCLNRERFVLVVHGGALFSRRSHPRKSAAIEQVLTSGRALLAGGATALDMVEGAIRAMEDSGAFNAGRGAIANQAGQVEMDASVMEGRGLDAGAVASVKTLKNPISAARIVMEKSSHVMMVGPDADRFVAANGGATVEPSYYRLGGLNFEDVPLPADLRVMPPDVAVPADLDAFSGHWAGVWRGQLNHVLVVESLNVESAQVIYASGFNEYWGLEEGFWDRMSADVADGVLRLVRPGTNGDWTVTYRWNGDDTLTATALRERDNLTMKATLRRRAGGAVEQGGTVGAVALDRCGDLAAGTSTGGFGSKTPGRVGDSPIIGAGTYADNRTAAVSATGVGEFFMRHVVAYDISALMAYKGLSLTDAAEEVVARRAPDTGLRGGVIAVDRDGNIAMTFNTEGMVRGVVRDDVPPSVALYR